MKFETPIITDKLDKEIEEAVARAEAVAPAPSRPRSERPLDLQARLRACVQKFPMSAVLTAFAGGLLLGTAVARRTMPSWQNRYISKPLRRQGREVSSFLSDVLQSFEHMVDRRANDAGALGRKAMKLSRKIGI